MAIIYVLNALIALGLIFFDDSKSTYDVIMENGAIEIMEMLEDLNYHQR